MKLSATTLLRFRLLGVLAAAAGLALSCAVGYGDPDSEAGDGLEGDAAGDVVPEAEADAEAGPDAEVDVPPEVEAEAEAVDDVPVEVPVEVGVEDVAPEESGPPPYDPWAVPRDCSPGPGDGEWCDPVWAEAPSFFYNIVRDAVNGWVSGHPEAFDTSLGYEVALDPDAYVLGVVADINGRGDVCSIQDPNAGDEIVVKRDNVLAENFDILTWDNRPRSGAGIFTGACAPAWF
jgi:hypothetical protein